MKALHFPRLPTRSSITKVSIVALLLALFLPLTYAMADDRRGFDDRRSFDRSWNSNRRHDNNAAWRREAGRRWDNRRNSWRDDRYDHNRYRRDDNSSVSLSLSFGNVTGSNWRSYSGAFAPRHQVGIGSIFYPGRFTHYDDRRPVIVYQNNYIERSRPVVRSKTYTSSQTGTSLLREISGRCFERTVDQRGIERRTEVPASVCDF